MAGPQAGSAMESGAHARLVAGDPGPLPAEQCLIAEACLAVLAEEDSP